MSDKRRSSYSIYAVKQKSKDSKSVSDKEIKLFNRQIPVGIIIGVFLTIITLILHCIALFTPHWKEVYPTTHSLYVDDVDALIRTEVLVYFNAVHRFTRQSYGLYRRCEYLSGNAAKLYNENHETSNINHEHSYKTCTKNFLPSYNDKEFNQCHSLQYYRFCSKNNEKNFNIHDNYLRPTFDIASQSSSNLESKSFCNCQYPFYVRTCHVLGIFVIISLIITIFLFGIFPFLEDRHQRLKAKCFGVLSSIFSTIFILSILLLIVNHLHHESLEYLIAIEKHYRANEIYKLAQDTKVAIDQFKSSINIVYGYSAILGWVSFGLSIINGILIMSMCKISYNRADINSLFTAAPESPQYPSKIDDDEHKLVTTPLTSPSNTTSSQTRPHSSSSPPPPPPLTPIITITNTDQQSKTYSCPPPSCLKQSHESRIRFEDEV